MKNFLITINIILILFCLVGLVKGAGASLLNIIPYAMALNSISTTQTKILDTVAIIFNIFAMLIAIFMLGGILFGTTGVQGVDQKFLWSLYLTFVFIIIPGLNIRYIRF
ncbi:MAG: hypothetical protein PHI02_05615 [Sulfurovaceae bacterium]|nr:hypothetical protein [Sulfurovaceae bacterium]